MIMESSVQARFLVPMAVSLGFGILYATFIILLIVPALYLILEDFVAGFRWLYPKPEPPTEDPSDVDALDPAVG